MKIALGQFNVIAGDPKGNVARMIPMIDEAVKMGAKLISFSEMCISGYLVGDLWHDDGFCREAMHWGNTLAKHSKNIAVAFGNVFVDERFRGKDGRVAKLNGAYVFVNGKPAQRANTESVLPPGFQPKTNLPNYRFFDDQRYFFSLLDIAMATGGTLPWLYSPFIVPADEGMPSKPVNYPKPSRLVGFVLCEDLWCKDYIYQGKPLSPSHFQHMNGAQAIINLSASPWTYGKNGARDRRVLEIYEQQTTGGMPMIECPYYYANCSGTQNNGKNVIFFDGGSTIYRQDGKPVVHAEKAEGIIIADMDKVPQRVKPRKEKPKIDQKYDAIVRAIKEAKTFIPLKKAVIGLSGGIDSAVVAAIFVEVLGPENVICINMPSKNNSSGLKDAALHIAEKLGLVKRGNYHILPIGDMVRSNEGILRKYMKCAHGHTRLPGIVEENVQAKIRGTSILSLVAQIEDAVFINCGNKVETFLGYATLYGDWGGGISPLSDCTKTEVYDIGRLVNKRSRKQVIPTLTLESAPTAELKKNQVDPIKLGYHCALVERLLDYSNACAEDILQWWLDGTLHIELGMDFVKLIGKGMGLGEAFIKDLFWFCSQQRGQVFKRVQSVPGVIVSKTAFGYDRRESMMPPFEWSVEAKKLIRKIKKQNKYRPQKPSKLG